MKLLKLQIIPALVVLIALIASSVPLLFSRVSNDSSLGFMTLVEEYPSNIFTKFPRKELLEGEKLKNEFISEENNLGIVLVRFYNFARISTDLVIFRIKEKGQKDWYYENKYKVKQFQANQYFAFGFPKIVDAKGKTFFLEIESVNENPQNAIAISTKIPQMAIAYKFSRSDFLEKGDVLQFFYKKLIYTVNNIEKSIAVWIYGFSLLLMFLFKKRAIIYGRLRLDFLLIVRKPKLYFKVVIKRIKDFWQKVTVVLIILYKPVIFLWKYILYLNGKYFPFLHIAIILAIAIIMRLAFYLDPKNFEDVFYSPIGGSGDYDQLIRNTMQYMVESGRDVYFWSLMDDYVINLRLFAVFFNIFGFVKGLDYVIYFLIGLSSLVCLLPFVLLSRLKKFSLGGFAASLFLAVNPLFVWLSYARPLDIITSFIFSIFIILFILALEKRGYILAFLLGAVGFIDVLNRGLMMLNNLPALGFFAGLFLYLHNSFSKTFPFVKVRIKILLLAFIPLITFLAIYLWWNDYYFKTFTRPWFFAPEKLVTKWNPVSDPESILGKSFIEKPFHYFLQLHIAVDGIPRFMFVSVETDKIPRVMFIPMIFLASLAVIAFLHLIKKKSQKKLNLFIFIFVPALYLISLYYLEKLLMTPALFTIDPKQKSLRYFLELNENNFITLFTFLSFTVLQIILLKREFFKYFFIIASYLLVLGYGIYHHFYGRHYIQVLLPLFLLFGLTIDKVVSAISPNKKSLIKYLMTFYILGIFFFVGQSFLESTGKFISNIDNWQKQKSYLQYARTVIPKEGIILVDGRGGQNMIWVYKYVERSIIFNASQGEPGFIIYGEGDKVKFYRSFLDKKVNLEKVLDNEQVFNQYKFYLLDYYIPYWEAVLSDKNSGHPLFYRYVNRFELKRINEESRERPIYQLVVKEKNEYWKRE